MADGPTMHEVIKAGVARRMAAEEDSMTEALARFQTPEDLRAAVLPAAHLGSTGLAVYTTKKSVLFLSREALRRESDRISAIDSGFAVCRTQTSVVVRVEPPFKYDHEMLMDETSVRMQELEDRLDQAEERLTRVFFAPGNPGSVDAKASFDAGCLETMMI
jgi:hypothetical protein